MVIQKIAMLLILAVSMMNAFARHGDERGRHDMPPAQSQPERYDARQAQQFDRQPQQPVPPSAAPDEARRPGRMSPEERRALRRQINEAGRDIYAPSR